MMVFKLALLAIFRLIIWAAVKVTLAIYILSLPDPQDASVVQEAEAMQASENGGPQELSRPLGLYPPEGPKYYSSHGV